MKQHSKNTKKFGRGGARIGAGRPSENKTIISITVPQDQLSKVDKLPGNRSSLYTAAMELYLSKP